MQGFATLFRRELGSYFLSDKAFTLGRFLKRRFRGQECGNSPELFRLEILNFALALHDETHRHRLNPAGT